MTSRIPVLVVGGGISGLVCAYSLRKAGIEAQVVEASPGPGGVIRSLRRDGFLLELGPQSFSATPPLRELTHELAIEKELLEAPPHAPRFILASGKLQQVPLSPPAFFASSLFSMGTKWSILRDVFGRSTPPAGEESVAAFVRRKFSPELLDKLVGPFVSGIYAGDPEKLSLRAAFPQLFEAEQSAGSIVRGMLRAAKANDGSGKRPALQTFREGNETLLNTLASKLGPALRCNAQVQETRCEPANSTSREKGFSIVVNSGGRRETIIADQLILATPTNVAARLLGGLEPEFERTLSEIEYAPVALVSLGYRDQDVGHSLDGFGFLVPRSAGLRILGTVWSSSLFPGRAPQGHVLLTSFIGGATDSQAIQLPLEELVATVHRELALLLSLRQAPVFSNVEIYERALPQYNLGHPERVAALNKLLLKFPNLRLVGNYLNGPSIGACVEQALTVAQQVASSRR